MAYAYVAGCDGAFEIRVQTSSPVDDTTTSAHAEEEANENGEAAAAVAPAHQPPTRVRVELSLSVDAVVMAVGARLEPSAAGGAVLTLLNFQSSTQPPPAIEHLNVTVTLPFAPRSVESIEHGALNFTATQAAVASRGFDRFYSEKQPDAAGLTEIRFAVPLLSFGDLVLLYAPTANGTTTSKSSK